MRAVSDSGPTEMNQEKPEVIKNLFSLMEAVSAADTKSFFEEQYNSMKIRYGDMKKQLAEDMIAFTQPFRERILELSKDEKRVHQVARQGAEKARESASKTIQEARKAIGIRQI